MKKEDEWNVMNFGMVGKREEKCNLVDCFKTLFQVDHVERWIDDESQGIFVLTFQKLFDLVENKNSQSFEDKLVDYWRKSLGLIVPKALQYEYFNL